MIVLRAQPLSTVLDQLLGPFELAWYQLDSELHVVGLTELAADIPPNQFWFDAAQRAMRQFEMSFPENERRLSSLLARANLSLIQNRLDIALNHYRELVQSQPRDELLAKLFFNQGKLQALLKQPQEASRLFYPCDGPNAGSGSAVKWILPAWQDPAFLGKIGLVNSIQSTRFGDCDQ